MPIKYSLRQFEVFVAVASTGSFTAAAEQLHTSRAALTATIDALESALGRPLFNRRRSLGISLTTAGEKLLPGAITLLHDAQRLALGVDAEHLLTGELVIGATVSLASSVLPEVLQRLSKLHPRLRVRVVVRSADELIHQLQHGGMELLFSYATPLHGVSTRAMFDARFGVLAPRGRFAAARGGLLQANELNGLPLAILDNPLSWQRLLDYFGAAGIIDADVRYRLGSLPLCMELVRLGLASAVVPLFPTMARQLPEGIDCLDLDPPPMPIAATVAWQDGVTLSPAAEAAIAVLDTIAVEGGW